MEIFRKYLEEAIGPGKAAAALSALEEEASTAIRINPSKSDISALPSGQLQTDGGTDLRHPFLELESPSSAIPWSPFGRILSHRPNFTLDPLFHAGAYYVQDSSAQFVGHVARQFIGRPEGRPPRVLDLCAAPGGKTTDLAASLRQACGDSFLLVANEVMRQRAAILSDNVSRWGDPCVAVTSADPAAFASLEGFFDMIVADVPCSGEGMFRKDAEALRQWSPDNVALCAARQKRIVSDVWAALAPGGILIYSTCTFNRHENDDNIEWIAENLDAEILDIDAPFEGIIPARHGASLVPGFVPGEGQYCAALRKRGGTEYHMRKPAGTYDRSFKDLFRNDMLFARRGETVVAVPESICAQSEAISFLRPLSAGTAVGTVKGRDLVPHPDLPLSIALRREAFPSFEAGKDLALRFLHRDSFVIDAPKGLVLITYGALPLGFVKNLGTRCNNLLPKDRRIMMDI